MKERKPGEGRHKVTIHSKEGKNVISLLATIEMAVITLTVFRLPPLRQFSLLEVGKGIHCAFELGDPRR